MKPWDLPTYGEFALIVIAIASVVIGFCAIADRIVEVEDECTCDDDNECPRGVQCLTADCSDCPMGD